LGYGPPKVEPRKRKKVLVQENPCARDKIERRIIIYQKCRIKLFPFNLDQWEPYSEKESPKIIGLPENLTKKGRKTSVSEQIEI